MSVNFLSNLAAPLSGTAGTTARQLLPVATKTEYPNSYSSGTYQSATYRSRHFIASDQSAYAFQLRFANRIVTSSGEAVPPDAVTYKCAVEYGGVAYPVTVAGSATWTLAGGAEVLSDPVAVRWPKGSDFYVRTMVSVDTAGKKWPMGNALLIGAAGEGWFTATDAVYATSTPGSTNVPYVGPVSIVAPLPAGRRVVGLIGSSTTAGVGDTGEAPTYDNGWPARAFANSRSVVKLGLSGDTAWSWVLSSGGNLYRRGHLLNHGVTHVVSQLGQNDALDTAVNLATAQDRLTRYWNILDGLGAVIIQTTFTPKSASTDGWTTLGNQTADASLTKRLALNDWVRGKPHAAMADVWDVAAVVEDATGGTPTGKWRVDGGVWVHAADGLGQHQSTYGHRQCAAAFAGRAGSLASY